MRRVEKPLIPPDAMREILVNALIHRDDTIAGGAVRLAIFDDRVEVWSEMCLDAGIAPPPHLREPQGHHSIAGRVDRAQSRGS